MSKSNHISQSAGKPLLGSAGVLAFSCGVILLYRFAVLPPYRWLFLSLIVLLFVGLLKSVRIPAAVVWLFWTVAGLGWAGWHADGRLQYVLPGEMERVPLTVSGYLCDLPQPGSFSSQRFTLCVHRWHDPPEGIEKNKLPNKIRLAWYGAADKILPSHRLRLQVVLKRPHGSLNDEGFRYEDWLFRQGVRATGSVREVVADPVPCGIECHYRAWHRGVATAVDQHFGQAEYYPLVASLLIGNRGYLDPSHWETLKATGTIHLVAISGLHLGLVALAAGLLSRRFLLGLPAGIVTEHRGRSTVFLVVMACCLSYALLAGFTVPTQRALIMVVVGGWYLLKACEASPWQPFLIALGLVLLVDPFAPLDQGFWLSFGAVALLLLVFAGRVGAVGWLPGLVIAQVAVFAGLWPILDEFGQGQPVAGFLANLVAIPWVSLVVMPVLFLGSLLAVASGGLLAGFAISLFDSVLGALWHFLEWAQAIPAVPVPEISPALLLALAAVTIISLRFPDRRFRVLAAITVLFWLMTGHPEVPVAENPRVPVPDVHVWDVGQGLSVLVRSGRKVLLYDTGPEVKGVFSAAESVLIPNLRALGVKRLDYLLISHADSDHAGGLSRLLAEFPAASLASGEPEAVTEKMTNGGDRRVVSCARDTLHMDGLELSFWQSPDERSGNGASCVLRVHHRESGVDLVLTGDISRRVEAQMLDDPAAGWLSGFNGRRVLLAPHHGSKTSSSARWIQAASPDWVIYTAGYRHRFGHPHPDVVQRYVATGAVGLNTACSGQLTIAFRSTGPEIKEARQTAPFWIRGPGLTRDQCKIP